ncbi:MAG: hypothetical protein ACI9UN_004062 [Granulosicoccus sp.]|jgi:hypothetical protein
MEIAGLHLNHKIRRGLFISNGRPGNSASVLSKGNVKMKTAFLSVSASLLIFLGASASQARIIVTASEVGNDMIFQNPEPLT